MARQILKGRSRSLVSRALGAVDVTLLIMIVGHVDGPWRFVLGLIFVLFVPGWSVIGLIRLRDASLEVGLTTATSLAGMMIGAQFFVSIGWWHPLALEELTCVLCLPLLILQSFSWHELTEGHSR